MRISPWNSLTSPKTEREPAVSSATPGPRMDDKETLLPRRPRSGWILCDFHIHTQWSDGLEPLETVVDLYGHSGFDAICISLYLFQENKH